MPSTGYLRIGGAGCLLPLLIIFNLFFGRLIFNSAGLWLGVEVVLVLIFMLKIRLMISRITQQFSSVGSNNQKHKPLGKVIDVQGQEVEDGN
ncbi:MAG: hypothetical protein V1830_00495 [Candidatus Omnitrophota bacterium]